LFSVLHLEAIHTDQPSSLLPAICTRSAFITTNL
jgi:hypothetical protein